MSKKLLCAKGCGKKFGGENAWKRKHEDDCKGIGGEEPVTRPTFKLAHHDPEEDAEKTKSTETAEEIALPRKPKATAPTGSAMIAAIEELKEKRKAKLIEVQQIDSLIQQLEALN